MPGGETYVPMNHVYHAKPDGLTLCIIEGPTAMVNQWVQDPKAKGIDLVNFNWICRINWEPTVLALEIKSQYRTLEDLKRSQRTIKFGATSKGSFTHIPLSVLSEVLGLNARIILGFGVVRLLHLRL